MDPLNSLTVLQPSYFGAILVGIFFTMALIMIPSVLASPGAKPESIAKATGYYMLKAFALLLMATSSTVITYSLVSSSSLPPLMPNITPFLLLFAVGLGTFTHCSRSLAGMDHASVAVPRAIFDHGCIVIGSLLIIFSGLALLLVLLITPEKVSAWAMPASLLLLSTVFTASFSLHSKTGRGKRK